MEFILLLTLFILSLFLGVELINKVPATLHTPLMSGCNAISGITLIGAIIATDASNTELTHILGMIAIILSTINVVSGFLVTHRMLNLFKKK